MNRENLFAYTAATGRGYPPYVSINRLETGDVEVTVRETPKVNEDCYGHDIAEGRTVSAIVPADEWNGARPPVVTDEVVERVAKIIDPIWMDPPEGPHVLENYPGHADYYRERTRERARAAIAAMPAVVSGGRPAPCPTCEGRGVYDSHPIPPDKGPAMEFECYTCNGTGNAPAQPEVGE